MSLWWIKDVIETTAPGGPLAGRRRQEGWWPRQKQKDGIFEGAGMWEELAW